MIIRYALIAVLGLFWMNNLAAQTIRCGVITHLEDSIHHHYIGLTLSHVIHEVYPTPFDLKTPLAEMTMNQLEQQYPHVEFVKIDESHYRELLASLEGFPGRRVWREKQLTWFEKLKQEYDIENLLVLSNVDIMSDIVTGSKHPIHGYGIYNGVIPRKSAVYMRMERYFFDESNVRNYFATTNQIHSDADLPRITQKNEIFEKEELMTLEPILLNLIKLQVFELLQERTLTRRMTRAFGKTGGE